MTSRKITTNSRIYTVLENILFPDGLDKIKSDDPAAYRDTVKRLERVAQVINLIFLEGRP